MSKVKDLRDFDSLFELMDHFTTEEVCEEYLATIRWNGNPTCPYCESDKVKVLNGTTKRLKCYGCKKQFGVKVGTIFHDTKISLRKWFIAVYIITAHKKGISSHQLSRDLKVTQKTAWFMLHRVREAYNQNAEMFSDEVEIDETYIGGKESNKHAHKKTPGTQGRSTKTKTAILGILNRNGNVYASPVLDTKRTTILPILLDKIERGSTVYTDEYRPYRSLAKDFIHDFVKHNTAEYVKGLAHTNNIEGFWAILKRGIIGIYHQISSKHLFRYVNEFSFRYNNRKISDASKFDVALTNAVNKRLDYKTLVHG